MYSTKKRVFGRGVEGWGILLIDRLSFVRIRSPGWRKHKRSYPKFSPQRHIN